MQFTYSVKYKSKSSKSLYDLSQEISNKNAATHLYQNSIFVLLEKVTFSS